MHNIMINLSRYYNHIMYKGESNENFLERSIYGLPHFKNIHIIENKKEYIRYNQIYFHCASNSDIFDNIMCDSKIIEVNKKNISSILFLGFSEMGTVCDEVILHSKNKTKMIPIVLKTFHSDSFRGIDDNEKNKNCQLITYLDGDDGQKHGAYCWKFDLDESIDIDSIELPFNLSMHIMAITLISN